MPDTLVLPNTPLPHSELLRPAAGASLETHLPATEVPAAHSDDRGLSLTVQEIVTACILMFYGTAAYIPVLMPNAGGAITDPSQVSQVHSVNHITLAVVWGAIAVLVAKSWGRLRFRSKPAMLCLMYSCWGLTSALWSYDPGSTVSAALSAVFSTLFAMYMFGRFPRRRIIMMFSWAFMGLASGSAFLALFLPDYGVDHFTHEGAWQGAFTQKNGLGNVMVYGMAIALAFQPRTLLQRVFRAVLFVASAAEVFLSQSREAWVLALVVIMIYPAVKVLARFAFSDRSFLVAVGGISLFVLVALAIGYGPSLLEAMGRDVTLTGRTEIWSAVLAQMPGHWISGYGLGSFWGSPQATAVYSLLRWTPSSAHNGYLESLLQLGIVGLGFTLVTLFFGYIDAWRSMRNPRLDFSMLAYTMMFVLPILNCVAYLIPYPNSINWALMIVSTSMLEQDARGHDLFARKTGRALDA